MFKLFVFVVQFSRYKINKDKKKINFRSLLIKTKNENNNYTWLTIKLIIFKKINNKEKQVFRIIKIRNNKTVSTFQFRIFKRDKIMRFWM